MREPGSPSAPEPTVLAWEAIPGDRWTALSTMGRDRLLVLAIPPDAAIDPVRLLRSGVRAIVTTICGPEELALARTAALAGGSYLSPRALALVAGNPAVGTHRTGGLLGPREVETLRCIVRGMTHREAARELGVTETTINTYAKRLRRKLDAGNKAELTQRAIALGYVSA
jgi:DNA-binding NarL/FixJ family response regulator